MMTQAVLNISLERVIRIRLGLCTDASAKGAEVTVLMPFLALPSSKLGKRSSMNSSRFLHNTRGCRYLGRH